MVTTLSKQAMPMIRYRTRDITAFVTEPCPCGRTLRRIRRIGRRSDDMLIIRGVNVFPSQIESALLAVEGTLPHYQIILTREKGLDQMEVQVEVTPEVFSDRIRALVKLSEKLIVRPGTDPWAAGECQPGRTAHHPAKRGEGQARDRPQAGLTEGNHENSTVLIVSGE